MMFNGSRISEIGSIISLKKKKKKPWNDLVDSKINISKKLNVKEVRIIIVTKKLSDEIWKKNFKWDSGINLKKTLS